MDDILQGDGYKSIFYHSQSPLLIVGTDRPTYTILDVNDAYLEATHESRPALVGTPFLLQFASNLLAPHTDIIPLITMSLELAIQNKKPQVLSNYRYDIAIPGTDQFEECYWTTTTTPVLNAAGEVIYLIHSPTNVTEIHKLKKREQAANKLLDQQQLKLQGAFLQAPVGIGILKGPGYLVDLVNPTLCEWYGLGTKDVSGKSFLEVVRNLNEPGLKEKLDAVRLTRKSFKTTSLSIPVVKNNVKSQLHLNIVFEPYVEEDGSIYGIIVVATEVTDLVSTKNKMEEAEARASLAVEAVGLGTFDIDLQKNEIVTSKKFANIFGFEEPVDRQYYINAIHPEDLEIRQEAHDTAILTGNLEYEARVLWKDGSVRWIRVEGKVYYNEQGEAVRIPGILLDVTQQKRDREEQRKLISLVENSVDLVSILNMDGINSYINEAGRDLLGFDSMEQVLQVPVKDLHTPQDLVMVETTVIPSVMNTGNWSGMMNVKHLKSGEIFPVYNNCFRIDDPVSGNPIAIGAVMRDLRPEIKAKQALAESESLLRNITNATPTALWMSDAGGNINYVNQTWVDWTGQPLEANMGLGWFDALVNDDKQKAVNKFLTDLEGRSNHEMEFRINHTDGQVHWCIANGQPQYNQDGSFKGYIGACVDITEQKLLQQQKDDFLAIASHELKTPVTSIKGYAQVLEKMLLKKGDAKEAMMMSRMDAQVKRLTNLINDLLDVTKINTGKMQFNNTVFDFNMMVKELVEELQRTSENHTLIGEYKEVGMICGDKERLSQVISNLITNAIKYSPTADRILIYTAIENGEVTLCVQDYGVGIPHDKLDRVFEQFYRVSGNMQHTFPGLGLGLYISSEIIKRVGGRIWVNSREGEGSTFCFALPLSQGSEPDNN